MVEPDSIVLEYLRHIRDAVDGVREDFREVKNRVGSLEREMAHVPVKVAELSERIDRMHDPLGRVETHLDLTNA
jgi:hypothetical protein